MNDWRVYTDATGEEATHVSWHEVLKAIASLNGQTHTLVHAAYGDHVDLVVGGGNHGRVLVQWKEHEPVTRHFVLMGDQPEGIMHNLTIEGEESAFPLSWCVPLEQAVPICGDLLRTLELSHTAELQWVEVG